MSLVVDGVMAKLQSYMPRQIGDNRRWSTAYVEGLIEAADNAIRERCELNVISVEYPLVTDQAVYDLTSSFISVTKVEFSLDGSTYTDYLTPVTLDDLDDFHYWWRKDTGIRPEHYSLLTVPGVPSTPASGSGTKGDPSRILIYRKMGAATSETIKVTGIGLPNAGFEVASEAVQSQCHVPYCLAIMKAVEDPALAGQYYNKFLDGCDIARASALTLQAEGV